MKVRSNANCVPVFTIASDAIMLFDSWPQFLTLSKFLSQNIPVRQFLADNKSIHKYTNGMNIVSICMIYNRPYVSMNCWCWLLSVLWRSWALLTRSWTVMPRSLTVRSWSTISRSLSGVVASTLMNRRGLLRLLSRVPRLLLMGCVRPLLLIVLLLRPLQYAISRLQELLGVSNAAFALKVLQQFAPHIVTAQQVLVAYQCTRYTASLRDSLPMLPYSWIIVHQTYVAHLLRQKKNSLWTPAQRKRASMLYFANVFYLFIYFFMAALFSGPG